VAEIKYSKTEKTKKRRMNMQQNVDRLLDKIREVGYDGLTDDEKDELFTRSRHLGKDLDDKD
jgi:hypothetical protein